MDLGASPGILPKRPARLPWPANVSQWSKMRQRGRAAINAGGALPPSDPVRSRVLCTRSRPDQWSYLPCEDVVGTLLKVGTTTNSTLTATAYIDCRADD